MPVKENVVGREELAGRYLSEAGKNLRKLKT
jgi:hypothetical protein